MQHLANKPNSLLLLAMQCNKLVKKNTYTHLKPHQIDRLINEIFTNFIISATNYTQQFNRNTAKVKTFADFSINVYELYREFESRIKSMYLTDYSNLLIECYRLGCGDADVEMAATATFQLAHDYYANELTQRIKAQTDKIAKKPTTKLNKTDINPSTTNKAKKVTNQRISMA